MDEKYEVVISGIGGTFPESDNVEELKKNLFAKLNLVTLDDRRWKRGDLEVPAAVGKISNMGRFDTTFFGIHKKLCKDLDDLTKQSIERSYEAIVDAGFNPIELNGSNTAVLMASTISESEFTTIFDTKEGQGFGILGHNRAMQANRVSYMLNLTGQSINLDCNWTGGMQVLEMAKNMISNGHARAALVGVAHLVRHPTISLQLMGMGVLNSGDKVKSFSGDADGYNRSEAIVVLFLQRAEDARRCYASLINVKILNFGDRSTFFDQNTYESFKNLLNETYSEANIDPSSISFLEADGTACPRIDALELNVVNEVLCRNRKTPLLIGSVKSNLGHTEASASLVSVVKALIALDTGRIPPNLHYSTPNQDVPALLSGKLKVVTEELPLIGDIVGVNAIGLCGSYGHVILRKNKKLMRKKTDPLNILPRLVLFSGREVEGVENMIKQMEEMPLDEEFIALMHKVFLPNTIQHMVRSYVILPKLESSICEVQSSSRSKELPVWFVFSGMGSQWAGMGKQLLEIPVFAAAINKCETALASKGISVRNIITNTTEGFFDNILHSFVGIAAIQVGLVDILFSIGIKPDGIVGHSVGELGCAYADGCFTAEEMILSAYARGQASIETSLIKGMMAAVGKGYNQIKNEIPDSIEVACHNSSESCTLSGPTEDMETYIGQVKAAGVFAKLVNVSNIAYHSCYIAPAAPALLRYLQEVIKDPKPRSERWVSSSIPEDQWGSPLASTSSPEYHTNNLLCPVLFEEACKKIPAEAILIEIAPHGLLQAILRRSKKLCVNIPLTQRDNNDCVRFLLTAIGKMYLAGLQPDIAKIYPPVNFPVSSGTPSLGPFVSWDHSDMWITQSIDKLLRFDTGEKLVTIDLSDPKDAFFKDHKINGRIILPVSIYLLIAWETLLKVNKEEAFMKNIEFKDVQIYETVEMTVVSRKKLYILLQKGTGYFEISLGQILIMSGYVNNCKQMPGEFESTTENNSQLLNETDYSKNEVYTIIDGLGYEHKNDFQVIDKIQTSEKGLTGSIKWNGNWVVFLDAFLKMILFDEINTKNTLLLPKYIQALYINPSTSNDFKDVKITYNSVTKILYSNNIEIKLVGVEHEKFDISPLYKTSLMINELRFISHYNPGIKDMNTLANIFFQLSIESHIQNENYNEVKLTVIKLSKDDDTDFSICFEKYFETMKTQGVIRIGTCDNIYDITDENHIYLIIASNEIELEEAKTLLKVKTRILILVNLPANISLTTGLGMVFQQQIKEKNICLLKKISNKASALNTYIVNSTSTDWYQELIHSLNSISVACKGIVYFINFEEPVEGLNDFIKKFHKIVNYQYLRYIFLLDRNCPQFDPDSSFYQSYLSLDLKVNIYKNGSWGSYKLFPVIDQQLNNAVKIDESTKNLGLITIDGLDVKYFSLNLKNLIIGDKVEDEIGILEYAGISRKGKRVMGLVYFEGTDLKLCQDNDFIWTIPPHWSLEDAATVPLPFMFAYYTLVLTCKVDKNERVLIHAGYTAIGQAAIVVALNMGCIVYTSYSTQDQKNFLMKIFPELPSIQIKNFEDRIFDVRFLLETKGKGFDVILNCLEGEKLQTSIRCLGQNGRFIQFGLTDHQKKSTLGMYTFLKSSSVFGRSTENLFALPNNVKKELNKLIIDGITSGIVKPMKRKLLLKTCTEKEAIEVLRTTESNNYGCRVLVNLAGGKSEKDIKDMRKNFICDRSKTYLIIIKKDDSTDLWLDLLEWLVLRGAGKLLVCTDENSMTSLTRRRFSILLKRYNYVCIKFVSHSRVDTRKDALNLLIEANSVGPLAAIFFLLLDINSKTLANVDWATRMDKTTKPQFLSIMSGGSQICLDRRKVGLPALALSFDKSISKPSRMLSSLDHLLNTEPKSPVIILAENNLSENITVSGNETNKQDINWIPMDLSEIVQLGQQTAETATFKEIANNSLCYNICRGVSTVFILPGLKPNQFDSLVAKLFYPTFKAVLPRKVTSINAIAEQLFQVLKRDFYHIGVFTLVAETWSGVIAIALAQLLESDGKEAVLLMIEASPETTKSVLSSFNDNLDGQLIKRYFSAKILQDVFSICDWDERIDKVLTQYQDKEEIRTGFSVLRSSLKALFNYEVPLVLLKGKIHLFRPGGAPENDNCNLNLYCKRLVNINIFPDMNLKQLLDSHTLSSSINNLVCYEHYDAAITSPDQFSAMEVFLNNQRVHLI